MILNKSNECKHVLSLEIRLACGRWSYVARRQSILKLYTLKHPKLPHIFYFALLQGSQYGGGGGGGYFGGGGGGTSPGVGGGGGGGSSYIHEPKAIDYVMIAGHGNNPGHIPIY